MAKSDAWLLAVAAIADEDRDAAGILTRAGIELARLAELLTRRFGLRGIGFGRTHTRTPPHHRHSFEQHLPAETVVHYPSNAAHHAAAFLAFTMHNENFYKLDVVQQIFRTFGFS